MFEKFETPAGKVSAQPDLGQGGLADKAVEDAVYDSQALRNFMSIDLSHQRAPPPAVRLYDRRMTPLPLRLESHRSAIVCFKVG